MLLEAVKLGAIGIKRDSYLCGNCPNIPVYQASIKEMFPCNGIVAVQANSPTINPRIIELVKNSMQDIDEIMTCHPNYSIYGSVWGISKERLEKYGDPYSPKPQMLIVDDSVDIHTEEDYKKALCQ